MRLTSCVLLPTKHQDVSVHQPSALSDLLGGSTSMDVDVDSVEVELNAYTRVQHLSLDQDSDPLMWWKQHVQEFPCHVGQSPWCPNHGDGATSGWF